MQKVTSKLTMSALALILCQSAYVEAKSSFSEVWDAVKSDPYFVLPDDPVSFRSFFDGREFALLDDSERILSNTDDLRERYDKRLHPTGICLAGVWTITQPNKYTGLFENGSEALVIARASSAIGDSERDDKFFIKNARAFGIAIKLYPTLNENKEVDTANFITLDNNTVSELFLDSDLTNDIVATRPEFVASPNYHNLTALPLAPAAGASFMVADDTLNPLQTLWRPLLPVSEAGLSPNEEVVDPTWIRITAAPFVPRVNEIDYREELDISNYPDGLVFDISVADEGTRPGRKEWEVIGTIEFDDTVASDTCDHRLHYPHPSFPDDRRQCQFRDDGAFVRPDEECLKRGKALKWLNRDKSLR